MKNLIGMVVALLIGVGLGYALKSTGENAVSEAPCESSHAKGVIADAGDSEKVKSLYRRIGALKRELAMVRAGNEAETPAQASEDPRIETATGARRGPGDFRDHMKKLEKENPEKYAQITNRFAQFRQRRRNHAQDRIDFLSSVDVSPLGSRAATVHENLQKAIVEREMLEERMRDVDLSDEDRRKLFGQMRTIDRDARQLALEERGNLLRLTAGSLGLAGDDAQALVDTVGDVIESTEMRGGMLPPPPADGEQHP